VHLSKRGYEAWNGVLKYQFVLERANANWKVPNRVVEYHWKGMKQLTNVCVMSAVITALIKSITMEGQCIAWYSFWENITRIVFPVACLDSPQCITVAYSTKACREWGWKNSDVVGEHPKLFVVNKNWMQMK
jgi:hypothetical protein